MASEIPEVDETGPEVGGDVEAPADGGAGLPEAAAVAAAGACISCGAALAGAFCWRCGQKNDDLRRSSFVLFRDFLRDTFGFDSRMWRTLGLLAAAPGRVPHDYAHGRRSRYTPPVRLFIVVSFLFFLLLGLTQTMFVAMEVRLKSAEEVASARAETAAVIAELPEDRRETAEAAIEAAGEGARACEALSVRLRFFVRPGDIAANGAAWRDCAAGIARSATIEIETGADAAEADAASTPPATVGGLERALAGLGVLVDDPARFNAQVNAWLPRIMFLMTPVLALFLAMFIRGRNALLFDHLVMSLYLHAVGFAVVGLSILLGQVGAATIAGAALLVLFPAYFALALKRAYGRGWIKTVSTSVGVGLLYLFTLSGIVTSIIVNQVWRIAA